MKNLIWFVFSLILFLLLAATGILLYRNKLLSKELSAIRAEFTLQKRECASKPPPSEKVELPTAVEPETPIPQESSSDNSERLEKRADSWRANKRVEEVEQYLTLTPLESDLLKERLASAGSPSFQSEKSKQIVAEIIGSERSAKFFTSREEAIRAADHERSQAESSRLKEKLSLSESQQSAVTLALSTINKELETSMQRYREQSENVTALHSAGDGARDKLRESFQEFEQLSTELRKVREERLRELLRPTLSDEQYNKLLEMQARDSAPVFDF